MKKIILSFSLLLIFGCQTSSFKFRSNMSQRTLLNGVEVYFFKNKSAKSFEIVAVSPEALNTEAENQVGLSHLFGSMLSEGTENLSKDALNVELSGLGSEIKHSVGSAQFMASASSLAQDSLALTKLFVDVLLNSKFENKNILDKKLEIMSHIKQVSDSPSSLGGRAFAQTMYAEHPYSRPSQGYEKTLSRLSKSDLIKRRDEVLNPKTLKIVLIGNWNSNVENFIFESFADLEEVKYGGSLKLNSPPELSSTPIFFDKPGLQQANVYMGFPGLARRHVDYEALKVGLFVLGGTFKSRLNQELRINRGLTYGVGASLDARAVGGLVRISGAVRHDKIHEFVENAKSILFAAAKHGVTEQELEKAKSIIRGQFPRGVETREAEASAYFSLIANGVEGEELYSYLKTISSLSLRDVNDALRKYLVREKMRLVILGNSRLLPKGDRKKLGVNLKTYKSIKL